MSQVRHLKYVHAEACERSRLFQPDPNLEAPFQLGFRPASAILCGDFNFQPDSPEYAELMAPGEGPGPTLVDAWRAAHPNQPHPPTAGLHGYPWPEKAACYDYFFVTDDLAPRIAVAEVQSETSVSDHQPIVLDLA
jgi:endonuclease/exonuclease/phosphatase family metal-dependent hydrolase